MSVTNDFLPFCPVDTGTNLLSQSAYIASPYLPIGNQPGIASSNLNNKVLRQASAVASATAQIVANFLQSNVNDDGNANKLVAQLSAALTVQPPSLQIFTSGSGFSSVPVYFFCASANATAGATYSNNSFVFTVQNTISSGTVLFAFGTGLPSVNGTLTLTSGTGDATITFFAMRPPIALEVEVIGAGGGGGADGAGSIGSAGGSSSFGGSLLVCGGGGPGGAGVPTAGGSGGTATIGVGATGIAIRGGDAEGNFQGSGAADSYSGTNGGVTALGGAGGGGQNGTNGDAGAPNSGAGGGGGGGNPGVPNGAGTGGGAGGYIRALITTIQAYAYVVGAGGAGGTGGSGGVGGAGSAGLVVVKAIFQ